VGRAPSSGKQAMNALERQRRHRAKLCDAKPVKTKPSSLRELKAGFTQHPLKEIKGDFSKLRSLKEINIKAGFTQRPLKEIKGVDYSKLQPIKPRYAFVVEDKDTTKSK
jgi:hypothetical protein